MEGARTAGYLAVAASIGALLTVFTYIPALIGRINAINNDLEIDATNFRVIADEAWRQLIISKGHYPGARIRRQGGYGDSYQRSFSGVNSYGGGGKKDAFVSGAGGPTCSCNARNTCPQGPPGPPGKPGEDGAPGARGEAGAPGLPGIAPPVTVDPNAGCRVCPMGPRGSPGQPGEPGEPGKEGEAGSPGRPGEDGRPGYPGNPGSPGEAGKPGKLGEPGNPGRDGVRGMKGAPGDKGEAGPIGQKGAEGYPGPDGQRGNDGPIGPSGNLGAPGMPGQKGRQGSRGMDGRPGDDAGYCPCPSRTSGVESHGSGGYDQPVVAKPPSQQYTPAPYGDSYQRPSAAVESNSYRPSASPSSAVEANPYSRFI